MVFCDPPYSVLYAGKTARKYEPILYGWAEGDSPFLVRGARSG